MKLLLSIIILFIPISILAKQICIAPAGCMIEQDTGFCPKCIKVKEEPTIIIKEVVVKTTGSSEEKVDSKSKRDCSRKWKCIVPPCDDMIDENGCLIKD